MSIRMYSHVVQDIYEMLSSLFEKGKTDKITKSDFENAQKKYNAVVAGKP